MHKKHFIFNQMLPFKRAFLYYLTAHFFCSEVALALTRQTLLAGCCTGGLESKMKRSFHPKRSGEASPADIGPTLSALLGVEFPAARHGRDLVEALELP